MFSKKGRKFLESNNSISFNPNSNQKISEVRIGTAITSFEEIYRQEATTIEEHSIDKEHSAEHTDLFKVKNNPENLTLFNLRNNFAHLLQQFSAHRQFYSLLILYAAIFFLAELLTAGFGIGYSAGLWLHSITFLAIIAHSTFADSKRYELLLAIAVLPLIRLLSFAMPLWMVEQTYWFPLVNFPLIISVLTVANILGYTKNELGLTFKHLTWQVFIILSAFLIGYIERLIIQPAALVEDLSFKGLIIPVLSLLIFTGFSEELLFRGVLQNAAIKNWGPFFGILYVSILFGIFHMGWNSFLDVAYVTLIGFIWGVCVYKTGSIIGVTFAHGIANVFLFMIFPILELAP